MWFKSVLRNNFFHTRMYDVVRVITRTISGTKFHVYQYLQYHNKTAVLHVNMFMRTFAIAWSSNTSMQFIGFQILQINPNDGFAKVHLGFILKREGNFEEAITNLEEGIASNEEGTTEGKYFFHLGDAYQRTGRPEEVCKIIFCN